MKNKPEIIAANYCVSFIDLLGQRAEYKNEGLLPRFKNAKDRECFFQKIEKTIKPIYNLQKDASDFLKSALEYKGPIRKSLATNLRKVYDEMKKVDLKQQRWSDGLVYFVSLLEGHVQCPMASIYRLFGTVGSLCFLGLAKKRPLRGAIDIAWGVELHPGELYGAAVASAYELESKAAQYPRIVISDRAVEYIIANKQNPELNVYIEFNRQLAQICSGMIAVDFDGYQILDYLGRSFKESITKRKHDVIFKHAFEFINEQLVHWRRERNTKLSMRYSHLSSYFAAHQDKSVMDDAAQQTS